MEIRLNHLQLSIQSHSLWGGQEIYNMGGKGGRFLLHDANI